MYAHQPYKVAHLRSRACVALFTSTRQCCVAKQMAHGAVELIFVSLCRKKSSKKLRKSAKPLSHWQQVNPPFPSPVTYLTFPTSLTDSHSSHLFPSLVFLNSSISYFKTWLIPPSLCPFLPPSVIFLFKFVFYCFTFICPCYYFQDTSQEKMGNKVKWCNFKK